MSPSRSHAPESRLAQHTFGPVLRPVSALAYSSAKHLMQYTEYDLQDATLITAPSTHYILVINIINAPIPLYHV